MLQILIKNDFYFKLVKTGEHLTLGSSFRAERTIDYVPEEHRLGTRRLTNVPNNRCIGDRGGRLGR